MYWKRNLTKKEIEVEVHEKKNYLYIGSRHDGNQIGCRYPEMGKGKEGFMFWVRRKAIARLYKALDQGRKVDLYRGSMAQQFYIQGESSPLLAANEVEVAEKEAEDGQEPPPETGTCVCDYPSRGEMTMEQWEAAEGHFNQAGGYCCSHYGNTCGYCRQYN